MECNKEEAMRAKEIAEEKMETKDFVGARKVALKAQQLYPDLENISQMIMVCDVHCSAENKVYGSEKDWYDILKVEPSADETLIRKQYRKFALILHPDKNKFAGATDAFKLIGEAQRVLLDRERRMLHDSKRKAAGRSAVANWGGPRHTNKPSNAVRQPWVQNNFSNATSQFMNQQSQQPQSGSSNNRPTFWTVCPFCSVRYQFYKDVVNRLLWCQSCKKSFTGYEINTQGATPGTNGTQPVFFQQKEIGNQGPFNMGPKTTSQNFTAQVGVQGHAHSGNPPRNSFPKTGSTSEVGGRSKVDETCRNVDMKSNEGQAEKPKPYVNASNKKRKHVAESSESCGTESSTDSDEDGKHPAGQKFECNSEQYLRRSTRSRQHVSYNEKLSDDDDDVTNPSKRTKGTGYSPAARAEVEDPSLKEEVCNMNKPTGLSADVEEDEKRVKQTESSGGEKSQNREKETSKADYKRSSDSVSVSSANSSPDTVREPEVYEYPDPDFSDFDKDRKEECFAVGQIWAAYDTMDAMPRFYARIMKVFSPGFKLRITWLESEPDDEDEIKWVDEGLPVSCGKFKHGDSENTEDLPMFSHLVHWEKGNRRSTYKIYPKKGEAWALFKNWDIKWSSDLNSKKKFEFEFVEVLTDYVEDVGVHVTYLGKVKGFACLFCRTMEEGMDSVLIPAKEIFRFSHMIPSIQMSGREREDVPKGSFELDPASLPTNLEEISVPENLKMKDGRTQPNDLCSNSPVIIEQEIKSEENASSQAERKTHLNSNNSDDDHGATEDSSPEVYDIPDPEFYNFDADKSIEKLQIGQIWALYSDEDGLPKYYAQIRKIDSHPEFKLHITWLAACLAAKDMIHWRDKKMPTCCGTFRLEKGRFESYTSTGSFSHQLRAAITDKKDVYAIIPNKGEVWALYRNWNAGMTISDLGKCEYDTVEVLEEDDSWISVLVLERVDDFNSVFKAQMKTQSTVTMKIPRVELLRFSHQIPAFRLTEERGGSLRGFWELDPAALPVVLFHPR